MRRLFDHLAALLWLPLLVACVAGSAGRATDTRPAATEPAGQRLDTTDTPPLVVASDLDNPPFASLDADGQPVGRDVEMMEAIGRALGRSIEWKQAPFDTLLPATQAGFVDVTCATLGVTTGRSQRVDFTRPYFETIITVVVRAGPDEPRGWDDLDGRRVAAGAGTTSESAVRQHLPRARLVTENKSGATSAERLLLGDVDGIAMDGPAAEALVGDSGGALTTLHTHLAAERYALALPKGRTELLAAINAALDGLDHSGQLTRWNGKYGLRETKAAASR